MHRNDIRIVALAKFYCSLLLYLLFVLPGHCHFCCSLNNENGDQQPKHESSPFSQLNNSNSDEKPGPNAPIIPRSASFLCPFCRWSLITYKIVAEDIFPCFCKMLCADESFSDDSPRLLMYASITLFPPGCAKKTLISWNDSLCLSKKICTFVLSHFSTKVGMSREKRL